MAIEIKEWEKINEEVAQRIWEFTSENEVFNRYPTLQSLLSKQVFQNLQNHGNPGLAVLYRFGFNAVKVNPSEEVIRDINELAKKENLDNPEFFQSKLYELEILRTDDSKEETEFFTAMFHELLSLFARPFHAEEFDFSDEEFFGQIADLGERYSKSTELRNMNGNRGSKHFIYINRTFFGLYNLMHDLKAKNVKINNFIQY